MATELSELLDRIRRSTQRLRTLIAQAEGSPSDSTSRVEGAAPPVPDSSPVAGPPAPSARISAQAGIRYQLLELHHQAIERIVRARGKGVVGELVIEALRTWVACGKPPPQPPPLRTVLSPDSEWLRGIVSWWLRQPEARAVLAPAKLRDEALSCAAAGDFAAVSGAQMQLALIIADRGHPDRDRARAALLEMMSPCSALCSHMAEA